jgi:hypothetical protein
MTERLQLGYMKPQYMAAAQRLTSEISHHHAEARKAAKMVHPSNRIPSNRRKEFSAQAKTHLRQAESKTSEMQRYQPAKMETLHKPSGSQQSHLN